ncbi:MAG: right-handed parallel beta-helix repeat-containing protein [Ignavibacteriales bacterium]|nr:right-handed parallel beta-helix repeat-containing protein [Ignavibacteriales bacterium]
MKRLITTLFVLVIVTGVNVLADVHHVTTTGAGSKNGSSWDNAHEGLQAALTAASSGDKIWVAKGTYKPSSYYDLYFTARYYHFRMQPNVAIYGGFAGTETDVSERTNYGVGGTNETILSGDIGTEGNISDNCYHVFYHPTSSDLTSSAMLDGFTIQGGNANDGSAPHNQGGGMFNDGACSPTITNCTFTSNWATYGAGMYNSSSSSSSFSAPSLTNCIFSSNTATMHGGGMYNYQYSSPTLTSCTFTSNTATASSYYGGGMCNYTNSSPTLTSCTFTSNAAYYGGGIYNYYNSYVTLISCRFSSNSAGQGGGGMYSDYCSPSLTNCTFLSNTAANAGGLYNSYSYPTLTNCTFSSNTATANGGGIVNVSTSPNNTIFNNCIIWGNEAGTDGDEIYLSGGGTTTLNHSCYATESGDIQLSGTFNTTNDNITSDPQFVGSSANSAHPLSIIGISPCTDVGDDSYNSQDYDIRGSSYPRKLNKLTGATGIIDMGAYEYKLNVDPLPVELTKFNASINGSSVLLNWQTATEVNNYGFEIERSLSQSLQKEGTCNSSLGGKEGGWEKIGFVTGAGNSNSPKEYSFTDDLALTLNLAHNLTLKYRLKQIDNDGQFKYSDVVEISLANTPEKFELMQNYPNPFNPTTTIEYSLSYNSRVKVEIFNMLGQLITTLIDKEESAGYKQVLWNANDLSSGIYIMRINAEAVEGGNKLSSTKKLLLLK